MGFNTILRVENTPGGILAKNIKKRIKNDKDLYCMKILVTEKNGNKLRNIANFCDLYVPDLCLTDGCFVCQSANIPTRGSCWREGLGYRIDCKICLLDGTEGVYFGETAH